MNNYIYPNEKEYEKQLTEGNIVFPFNFFQCYIRWALVYSSYFNYFTRKSKKRFSFIQKIMIKKYLEGLWNLFLSDIKVII